MGAGSDIQTEFSGPSHLHVQCLALVPSGIFVGTSEAGLYTSNNGRLTRLVGFADVDSRTDWFTPWGGPPDVRTIVMDPVGTLFANVPHNVHGLTIWNHAV